MAAATFRERLVAQEDLKTKGVVQLATVVYLRVILLHVYQMQEGKTCLGLTCAHRVRHFLLRTTATKCAVPSARCLMEATVSREISYMT